VLTPRGDPQEKGGRRGFERQWRTAPGRDVAGGGRRSLDMLFSAICEWHAGNLLRTLAWRDNGATEDGARACSTQTKNSSRL